MVASARSIEQMADILLRRLGRKESVATIGELRRVKGNRSFMETLRPLSSSSNPTFNSYTRKSFSF